MSSLGVLLAAFWAVPTGSAVSTNGTNVVTSAVITSRTCDLDRNAGVVQFEGAVFVRYSDGSTMNADEMYMFLANSNELSRVVAIGNVVVSNGVRVGTCPLATYRRRKNEVEMFWDGKATLAHLTDCADRQELTGTRIKFWIDTEQVEVDDAQIAVEQKGGGVLK